MVTKNIVVGVRRVPKLAAALVPDGAGVEVEDGFDPFVGLIVTGLLEQSLSY